MAKKRKTTIDTSATKIIDDELPKNVLGDFLRVDDVADGETAIIKSPAYVLEGRFGQKRVVQVFYKKKTYALQLNKLSLKNLVDAYGRNSEDWIDKTVRLTKTEVLNKTAIVVEPL